MHRAHKHNDYYDNQCVASFALGVIVGIVGSMKIRFLHKLCKELHKEQGHHCCSNNYHTNSKEDTESTQANGNETE